VYKNHHPATSMPPPKPPPDTIDATIPLPHFSENIVPAFHSKAMVSTTITTIVFTSPSL
jgi:hypothetical protein